MRLRPDSLGPSAVLIVRRLADPLPGTLARGQPSPTWQRAVSQALERALRSAARPAAGTVPAGAQAVLFADPAELLAALAADWLAGELTTRWWWRLVAPMTGTADPPLSALRAEPQYVPAVLGLLAEQGRAVAFVRALPPAETVELLALVAAAYGMRDLRPVPARPDDRSSEPGGDGAPPARGAPPVGEPWLAWAPEAATPGLARAQRLLLGAGLALRRAPSAATRPWFWRALCDWLDGPATRRADERARASRRPAATTPGDSGADQAVDPPLPTAGAAHASAPAQAARPQVQDTRAMAAGPAPPAAIRAASRRPPDVAPPSTSAERPAWSNTNGSRDATTRQPAAAGAIRARRRSAQAPSTPSVDPGVRRHPHRPQAADRPAKPLIAVPGEVVDTRLGGLFYLLNLGLRLGLYGDFTTPAEPGIPLGPWDFVTLLGSELLDVPLLQDPVWGLLARLAGRGAHEPAGRGFVPPGDWRAPPEWLEPFGDTGVWRWSAAGGRLRLAHPAGFLALDVPRTAGSPAAQLAGEGLGPAGVVRGALGPRPARPLRCWVVTLAGYARARLGLALDRATQDVGGLLLRQRAQVVVTPAHVDVTMPLAELPIEIRRAGLDRDPGWIPAAGRVVALHFD